MLTATAVFLGFPAAAEAEESRSTAPTWDIYPARTKVMNLLIVRSGGPVRCALPFGGFSLPAGVPTFFGGTQVGPRGGAIYAIRQALDNAKSSLPAEAEA